MRKPISLFSSFLLFSSLAAVFNSCQDVIDIELKDADRKYVIEGSVVEGADSIVVRVSRTTSYFDTLSPEGINDAFVTVTMPDNTELLLEARGGGYYTGSGAGIITEANYKLRVDVGGATFTATTYMPAHVQLDSLEYVFNPGFGDGSAGYDVFLFFQDQIGKNYYKINSWVDSVALNKPNDLLTIDDNLNDGNPIYIPIFTHLYAAGDNVQVELQSIDGASYDFYQTLAPLASGDAGSPFSAAPANPVSNIRGGALGIWAAYTSSKLIIDIPL